MLGVPSTFKSKNQAPVPLVHVFLVLLLRGHRTGEPLRSSTSLGTARDDALTLQSEKEQSFGKLRRALRNTLHDVRTLR